MPARPVATLAAAGALLVGAVGLAGCGSDDAAGPQIRRVGSDYDTIQDAVDAAAPGDLVLIGAGTYREAVKVTTPRLVIRGEDRNEVVLDGRNQLTNGIEISADQVAVENLTVQRYTINGIVFADYGADDPQGGPVGWRASYVTAANNGLYGVYAFGATNGQFDHVYASGHPDSGIYVGQCEDCGAVVRDSVMERNAIGYENTNAGGVLVAANLVRRNRVGMTIASGDQEDLAPQVGGDIVRNRVVDNVEPEAPATEGGFGVGIVIAGGTEDSVMENVVSGHSTAGILLVDQDGYGPSGNRIAVNRLSANAVDLAYQSDVEPDGDGNCFADNRAAEGEVSTVPANLLAALPCPSVEGPAPSAELATEPLTPSEAPEGVDPRDVPLPGPQPGRPGRPDGAWRAPGRSAPRVDTSELRAPGG